ncbi:MAG TPA: hypothetical protein PLP42_00305 [Acidobacteriota bacterium]|nr:hypothetical protein [Acidobacteriota bacterium]
MRGQKNSDIEAGLESAPEQKTPWIFRIRTEHLWRAVPFLLVTWISSPNVLPALDFWWHLKAGEIILQTRSIPTTDLFSYTQAGKPFVLQNWLAEVVLYGAYRAGGPALLVFFNTLVLLLTLVPVYLLCSRRAQGLFATVLTSSLAAISLACIGNVRPQVFSFLLFAWFYYVLAEYYERQRDYLWVLPVMMALWVNLHGAFVLGIALFLFMIVVDSAKSLFGRSAERAVPGKIKPVLILALTLAATLCNPQFAAIYGYVAEVASDPISQRHVIEWQPPEVSNIGDILRFFGPFLLGIVILIRSKTRPRLSDLVLFMALAIFALTARRNAVWFALAVAPILAGHFELRSRPRLQLQSRLLPALNLLVAAVWLITTAYTLPWYRQLGNQQGSDLVLLDPRLPVHAVDFIAERRLEGRIFHPQHYGDYLVWRLWPEHRVFFDGRVHLFPKEVAEEYLDLMGGCANWQAAMDRYQIRFLLLDRKEKAQQRFLKNVEESAGWELLYKDERSVLYGRAREGSALDPS